MRAGTCVWSPTRKEGGRGHSLEWDTIRSVVMHTRELGGWGLAASVSPSPCRMPHAH